MQFSRLSALLKNLIHSDKFLRFSSNYQLWKLKKVRLVQFNWRKEGGEVHIVNMRQLEMKTSLRAKLFIIIVQVYESECDDQKNFLAAWGLLKTNFFHGVKIRILDRRSSATCVAAILFWIFLISEVDLQKVKLWKSGKYPKIFIFLGQFFTKFKLW